MLRSSEMGSLIKSYIRTFNLLFWISILASIELELYMYTEAWGVGFCYSAGNQKHCERNGQQRKSRRRTQQKFLSGTFRSKQKFLNWDSCLG